MPKNDNKQVNDVGHDLQKEYSKNHEIILKLAHVKYRSLSYLPIRTSISFFVFIIGLVLFFVFQNNWVNLALFIIFLTSLEYHFRVLILFFINTEELQFENNELGLRLELEDKSSDKNNVLLRKHYLHLHKYYRQSLSQSKNIFGFGIILAILGFCGIPAIIWASNIGIIKEANQPWLLAIVQAFLVSFVLGIFLKMYEKTTDSVNQFYQGLLEAYKEHSK